MAIKGVTFLTSVLESALIKPDEDDQLFFTPPNGRGKPVPLEVKLLKNKRDRSYPIYLPTEEMHKGEHREKIKYFPLAENVFLGNSEMLNLTIRVLGVRLHLSTNLLIHHLIKTKLDKNDKSYGNKVIEALKGVKIKTTLGTGIIKMLKSAAETDPKGKDALVKIGLNRNPDGKNKREAFAKIISTDKDRLFGKNHSQQQRDILQDLLTGIFGDIDNYTAGSTSMVCPSYFSVLKTFALLADRINEIARDLGENKNDDIIIPDDWFELLEDEKQLEDIHLKEITAKFPGNEGNGKATDEDNSAKMSSSGPVKRSFGKTKEVENHAPEVEEVVAKVPAEESVERESNEVTTSGMPKLKISLGGPSATATINAAQQTQQTVTSQPVYQGQVANTGSNGYSVVTPKRTTQQRQFHAKDALGRLLYWESGEPYQINSNTDTLQEIWEHDVTGAPLYHSNGEPSLVSRNVQQAGGLHQQTHGGHQQVYQPQHSGMNLPSAAELANMTYAERKFWERKISELNAPMQQPGMYQQGGLMQQQAGGLHQQTHAVQPQFGYQPQHTQTQTITAPHSDRPTGLTMFGSGNKKFTV